MGWAWVTVEVTTEKLVIICTPRSATWSQSLGHNPRARPQTDGYAECVCTCDGVLFSHGRNIPTHAATWVDLRNTMSRVIQTQGGKSWGIPWPCRPKWAGPQRQKGDKMGGCKEEVYSLTGTIWGDDEKGLGTEWRRSHTLTTLDAMELQPMKGSRTE